MGTKRPWSFFFRRQHPIVGLLFCLGLFWITSAHSSSSTLSQAVPQPSAKEIRDRISTIIRDTIRQGQGTLKDGTKFWTRVPPSTEAVKEIWIFGDRAIPVLEDYIWAEGGPEANLALTFLGGLGGSRIVGPLKRIVEQSTDPSRRETALRLLSQAPLDLALTIIRSTAETDPDPKVREVAKGLIVNYSPQGK